MHGKHINMCKCIYSQTDYYIVLFIHFLFIDEESIDYATNGYSSQKGSFYFIITISLCSNIFYLYLFIFYIYIIYINILYIHKYKYKYIYIYICILNLYYTNIYRINFRL